MDVAKDASASEGEWLAYDGLPVRIRSSPDELAHLPRHLSELGAKRVMVVCGRSISRSSDIVERAEEAVGDALVGRFDDVLPHSPLGTLAAAADKMRRARPDTLVSVGGGSTLAIAKGMALLDARNCDVREYQVRVTESGQVLQPSTPFPNIKMKVVAVPTTMGCAEIGGGVGGFRDERTGEKIAIGGGHAGPSIILIDGSALQSTPARIQKATAVGQLRVAIESFASTGHNVFGDALTLHATRLLVAGLEHGWKEDVVSLLRMKAACCAASLGMATVGSMGVCSATAHQLGALCDVPHGEANAILLPYTLEFNGPAMGSRLFDVAAAMGVESPTERLSELGGVLAERIRSMVTTLGLPTRLRDVGVTRDVLGRVAAATLRDRSTHTNPEKIDNAEQIELLLSQAY